ncbi:2-succinyl-5-enolpyruvyl-6-hydroxy-3-cyclohexene-1-carboxylic-acid synthase [Leptolyngbya sp. FACHB-541]|uniref:2-succinyl-5-enolpyruvyl-6-hydroxy-3- cyclohexene-1-carboxylic-acid synthase n=1 Tax=Leptolyngbya sp. FACHB-541 TaxID=2692810 RepID=UPI0016894446|nr:2-succinyl-5-enolpyruvyl-6-hydroxy-3-cyclohexene-1-carboxylic-acid synthase [Leptolyngbya sp. FACHB-541]MBD1996922.1 2-succinyl-5-enolpyruvyl-6-hydroxy-3-cyclohexene-1-carboxylic-acid synthase [Leptolyngbya sp. FACHB-541]
MSINFSNTNSIWASVFVETLSRLGLKTAIICPGSRSTPLTLAFAAHKDIEAIAILDERSAAFFALGIARKSGLPVVLVCTSGTAGANFYPAVIEARESRIPLLILTADRPPELRECNAGQTIDQQKLYGTFPNWYSELTLPSLELDTLAYLRQTTLYAWEKTLYPIPGPVHLNQPFRDPLAPLPQSAAQSLQAHFPKNFFAALNPLLLNPNPQTSIPTQSSKGILIAGIAQPQSPQRYCEAIAHLAKSLGFPVLAEGLSPVRNYADLNPYLISTYDLILRNSQFAEKLTPELVIRIGEMPTSKELRQWLAKTQPTQWVVDESDRNLDPTHGRTTHLRCSVEQFAANLQQESAPPNSYLDHWLTAETQVRQTLDQTLSQTESLFEGKVAWLLSRCLPEGTPLFIANSMPVRDVEWFWQPGNRHIRTWFNRGANGIDGTLSTALGVAHRHQSSVLLTGDLALLHDTNGFLISRKFVGHLTIVLINNDGGGIFEMLAIAQFDPPFEEFFAAPQSIHFNQLCATYGVEHELIQSWEQLQQRLSVLPETGIRVLEVQTDRKIDSAWRKEHLGQFAAEL